MVNPQEYRLESINNLMSLRLPQYESLQILDKIMEQLTQIRDNDMLEKRINELFPIFKSFERAFPSFAFALATGVGKTLLMGAFITYLYTNHGIKNFFVIAPNLTIYNKLIEDFGSIAFKKYVFKRIGTFVQTPPTVVTGDTYQKQVVGQTMIENSITINIFNIGKINAEVRGNSVPQVKRLSEYLGQSYFDYLAGLPDLVVLMDESHHYRADRGMTVINELNPLLGLEVTATPQVEKSNKTVKFKNVVYEYSLAKAIVDGYVKEPAAATRKDFNPRQYTNDEIDRIKLNDGIHIHRNTKAELELYAKNEGVKVVKPFVLVVCKDTTHAEEIKEYILSDEFFDGYYADKVIEVHSNQRGEEKDENIQKLISLEDPKNNIEIVIHVNMLKEGWDVTNLYTIIPLRTATSMTLREQTIGRGLRLPYGEKTGNAAVDRLTIVAHDKFDEIIKAANEESSIIKKENIIMIDDDESLQKEKEITTSKTVFDDLIEQKEKKLRYARSEEKIQNLEEEISAAKAVGQAINDVLSSPIDVTICTIKNDKEVDKVVQSKLNNCTKKEIKTVKKIITTKDLEKPEVKEVIKKKAKENLQIDGQISMDFEKIDKKIEQAISPLCEQRIRHSIDIPDVILFPNSTQTMVFNEFELSFVCLNFTVPTDDLLIETLRTSEMEVLKTDENLSLPDTPENIIFSEILDLDTDIDYELNEKLMYDLINKALLHIKNGKTENDFIKIIIHYKKDIAREIYGQMMNHTEVCSPEYDLKLVKAVSEILPHGYSKYKEDEILGFTTTIPAYELKSKVFGGFSKSCHTEYKFDSVPEQIFSIILEHDENVQKWFKPALKQFKIIWKDGMHYNPDFVAETDKNIYIIEIKSYREMNNKDVILKAKAAKRYCEYVNIYAKKYGTKPFIYRLIRADSINRNSTFLSLTRENNI